MQCGATDVASFLPSIACSLSRGSSVGEHLSRSQEVKRTWVSWVRVPPRAAHGFQSHPGQLFFQTGKVLSVCVWCCACLGCTSPDS